MIIFAFFNVPICLKLIQLAQIVNKQIPANILHKSILTISIKINQQAAHSFLDSLMHISITDPNKYCFSKRPSKPYRELSSFSSSLQLPRSRLTLSLPKLVKSKKQYYSQNLSQHQTPSCSLQKIHTQKNITNQMTVKAKIKAFKAVTDANKKIPNQDRCIIKYLQSPNRKNIQKWKERLYFAIFDGHGGDKCCEFLANRMDQYISREKEINVYPVMALKSAFDKAEEDFTKETLNVKPIDRSGSCALVCLSLQSRLYVANTGDSRCIAFYKNQQSSKFITPQHSPSKKKQYLRIISNGGKVTKSGPSSYRIVPGYLNVSRTFGDLNCKVRQLGGLPQVIIHDPDIQEIASQNLEYLLLCSDGLVDGMSKEEIHSMYMAMREREQRDSEFLELFLINLREEAKKKTSDNISIIVILFQ